jgi:hypothetical protein
MTLHDIPNGGRRAHNKGKKRVFLVKNILKIKKILLFPQERPRTIHLPQ